jgi:hypothetical protein
MTRSNRQGFTSLHPPPPFAGAVIQVSICVGTTSATLEDTCQLEDGSQGAIGKSLHLSPPDIETSKKLTYGQFLSNK